MLKVVPAVARERLRFREIVEREFTFLQEHPFAFLLVRSESTFVRFESSRVFVNIFHGRASYELGCEIGQRASSGDHDPEEGFSIWEVAMLHGAEGVHVHSSLQASEPDTVETAIRRLAQLVKTHARDVLLGSSESFALLAVARTAAFEKGQDESALAQARAEVASAWQRGDHRAVIEILEPWEGSLSPSERARLSYARRKCGLE